MLFEGVPVLESALDRIVHLEKCSRGLGKASYQIPLSLLLFLDSQLCWTGGSEALSYVESLLGILLLSSGLSNTFSYFFPMFRREKIPLSHGQMSRLGIKRSPGFSLLASGPKTGGSPPTFAPLEGSFIQKDASLNSSSCWMYGSPYKNTTPKSENTPRQEDSSGKRRPFDFKRSHFPTPTNNLSSHNNSSISDEKSLTEYLRDFEAWEKSHTSPIKGEPGNISATSPSSFWKSPSGSSPPGSSVDYSPILKKYSYQLASQPPTKCGGNCSSPGHAGDSCESPKGAVVLANSPSSSSASLHREASTASIELGVDPLSLVQMTQNLRMWISHTVLSRVVKEIDSTNKALSRLGLSDCKVGEVGLEKIKKNSHFHFNNIPSLSSLLPFLEVSVNQEYLVGRLRQLCSGGAMGNYRWNGGGSYKGHEWSDKLVSDAEIVMHCVACYLDSRLPPNYDYIEGDGRAFSSVYYFKSPEKPQKSSSVAIVMSPQKPPYYYLQFKDKVLELEPGRNNLFHVLLMFMHHIKTKENGMVGRINFGLSGVNILWVLDS